MAMRGSFQSGFFRLARVAVPALRMAACLAGLAGCQPSQSPPPSEFTALAASAPPLIVEPDPISLGLLAPGQGAQATLTLRNPHPEAVTVERAETSCPCIRVEPRSVRVEAEGEAPLIVSFDPTESPNFRGGLGVKLVGRGLGGEILCRTRVDLEVRSEASASPGPGTVSARQAGTAAGTR